ncbi:nitroreductase [Glycocaulis profundi]|nr:nitroreductase [Glycocaulis profundi]
MPAFAPLPAPEENQTLDACRPSRETLELLATRRSTLARNMTGPGPSPEEVDALIALGARVPDHGKLFPWRFIVFEGEARDRFGAILEAALRQTEPDGPDERYRLERERFTRAPVVIAVISDVTDSPKIPEWEQILSAGAVCQNLLIGASAMGYAAQWLTEWYAYDDAARQAMGLTDSERVAGFVYVGTAAEAPVERPRRTPRVTRWNR